MHRPTTNCELDHTEAYGKGGKTSMRNLAHLCRNHHNHLKHEAGWSLKQYIDGVLEWRAPSGRTYRTHPELDLFRPPNPTDWWARAEDAPERSPFDVTVDVDLDVDDGRDAEA